MTNPATSFDICIHGAGFVGRTLALRLAQSDFAVALVDTSAPHPATDIRAFSLNPTAKALLARVNAWPADSDATPVVAMRVFGDAGGKASFDDNNPLNWIVDVPALAALLKERTSAEPRITCLASDDALKATLHVVCEGKHSQLLAQLDAGAHTIHYEQHAIAARLVCEHAHHNTAYQWFNERGEVLALLPMQGNAVALVWSLKSERAKKMQAASETDFTTALEASCSKALGAMTLFGPRALWPLQLTRMDTWAGQSPTLGTWVLAGDAAHAMHPLAGQGLNVGLGDAALLAETLQKFLDLSPIFKPSPSALMRALGGYVRERQAAAASMSYATDGLHLLFAHGNPLIQQGRNWGMKLLDRATVVKKLFIRQAQ
ncbi:MAG: FAD-dependent monooxygenase [Cytophagales bacterium]|nr:FAD-dependent monooxygenase [Cytophagales bacterium]